MLPLKEHAMTYLGLDCYLFLLVLNYYETFLISNVENSFFFFFSQAFFDKYKVHNYAFINSALHHRNNDTH